MEALTCVFALLPIGTQNLTKIGKYCDDQMCHIQMVDLHYCEIDCGNVKIPGSKIHTPDGSRGQSATASHYSDLTTRQRVTFPPGPEEITPAATSRYSDLTTRQRLTFPPGPEEITPAATSRYSDLTTRQRVTFPPGPEEITPAATSRYGDLTTRQRVTFPPGPEEIASAATSRYSDLTTRQRVTLPPSPEGITPAPTNASRFSDGSGKKGTYQYCTITGYSFKYVKETSTWFDAYNACIREGAQLASIHSHQENEFVHHLVTSDGKDILENAVWIGAHRNSQARRNGFTWADGTPYRYSNWAKFQPDNKKDRDCVAMLPGSWKDLPCWTRLTAGYVCKKKFKRIVISPASERKVKKIL